MSTAETKAGEKLALFGGPKAVARDPGDMFTRPIVTEDDERAVLEVLRAGKMSGMDVTRKFEAEFAAWQGLPFALAHVNGTAALQAAMWAVGVRRGDELICPSMTYWASGLPALSLGATVVWADIQRHSLCVDPASVAERITERTRAIVVVHYSGYPADVDEILALARPRGIRVIEDVSHAHGGVYKGRKLGSIGHVAAMSCMSGKSLPIGEGGMLVTGDRPIHERAVLWGHYQRFSTRRTSTATAGPPSWPTPTARPAPRPARFRSPRPLPRSASASPGSSITAPRSSTSTSWPSERSPPTPTSCGSAPGSQRGASSPRRQPPPEGGGWRTIAPGDPVPATPAFRRGLLAPRGGGRPPRRPERK